MKYERLRTGADNELALSESERHRPRDPHINGDPEDAEDKNEVDDSGAREGRN